MQSLSSSSRSPTSVVKPSRAVSRATLKEKDGYASDHVALVWDGMKTGSDTEDTHRDIELSTLGLGTSSIVLQQPQAENDEDASGGISLSLKQERIYLATLCWCMFLTGWNAGTLGPLIPTIQNFYHVSAAQTATPTCTF